MLEVILDPAINSYPKVPLIQGSLPAMWHTGPLDRKTTRQVPIDLDLVLYLLHEHPIIEIIKPEWRMAGGHGWHMALRDDNFDRWSQLLENWVRSLYGKSQDPKLAYWSRSDTPYRYYLEQANVWVEPYRKEVKISIDRGTITITDAMLGSWHGDLGRLFSIGKDIATFVEAWRSERQAELLRHVDALITTNLL